MYDDTYRTKRYWRNRAPEERVKYARIPKRYAASDPFADAAPSSVSGRLATWAERYERGKGGLYLIGGVQASEAACAVLRRVLLTKHACGLYVSMGDLDAMFLMEARNDGELTEPFPSPYLLQYIRREFDLVVIDGLGTERATSFMKNSIATLVTARFAAMLDTIFVTRYSYENLEDLYGTDVREQIKDSTLGVVVNGEG